MGNALSAKSTEPAYPGAEATTAPVEANTTASDTNETATSGEGTTTPAPGTQPHPDELDLVFVVDCTASMGSYIASAQTNIRKIMERIVAFEKTDARFGLVAYRDHPPQDRTFVTRTFEFTSSRKTMQSHVDWMSAQGGGDGPEAVAAGLKAAVDMDWRKGATKVVILIADAPPHGLGEVGDGFPNGCPDGNDPLALARQMLERGITCYPVGCEPALGQYDFARDFMCTLARITEGQAVTLSSAKLLAEVIIGGAQEEVALEKLMDQITNEVEEERLEATSRGEALDEAAMCERVQKKLASRGMTTRQMKHNSKMEAPQADLMSGMTSLGAWRKAAPAKKKKKNSRGMLRSAGAAPALASDGFSFGAPAPTPAFSFSAVPAGASTPPEKRSRKFKSAPTSTAATAVTVEEDLISHEQVMRCMKRSAARKSVY